MAILYNPFSPIKSNIDYIGTQGLSGITDQRGYYYPYSGFLNYLTQGKIKHNWYIRGEKFREQKRMAEVFSAIGFFGFAAGPKKYIIDEFGLSDPLLSRLPVEYKKYFWIGHFKRKIPRGYAKSIMLWKNKIKDPDLELYYDKIVNITRGSIFSLKRFKDIFYLNTGKFEHLKDLYFNNPNYIIENYPKSCLSCKLKSRE
jgi:arabinofuranosyltransferase